MPQFMGGSTDAAPYGVPPPTGVNIQGTGGYPSPGAALISGLAAGQNLAGNAIENYRGRQQYEQEQGAQAAAQKAINATPTNADQAQNAAAHQSFLSSVGAGLRHIGSGLENFFGGGASPAPSGGAIPSPAATAAPAGIPAPSGIPAGANPQAAPAQAPQMLATGGKVLGGYDSPSAALPNPEMMADGGPVPAAGYPNPGMAATQGALAGQQVAGNAIAAARGAQQYQQDQAARIAAQQAITGAVPGGPSTAESHPVEQFAQHLHDVALNDAGVPNGKQGITGVTPQQNLVATASNPAAAQGIPERSPTESRKTSDTPHSITPDWWDQSDQLMRDAVGAAARAGHDPSQTLDALNHVRTSFIQGHVLRNLSAASVALQNGDNDAVEKALRNANYYLPNGQDLNVEKNGQGQLVYQNPLHPFLDSNNMPTDQDTGKPNMIPVDQAHLQYLGTAMLDPMKVNDLVLGARAAGAKMQLETARAQAALTTAEGARLRGEGAFATGAARLKTAGSQIGLNDAHAQYYSAAASRQMELASQGDKNSYKAGEDAAHGIFSLAQGLPTTVPVTDAKGNPTLSPAAGKTIRDPSKIPVGLQGKSPEQVMQISSLAGEIASANAGRMPTATAQQIAIEIYNNNGATHRDPASGKPVGNVVIDKTRKFGHFWNGRSWIPFRMTPTTGGALASGQVDTIPAPSGESDTDMERSDVSDAEREDPANEGLTDDEIVAARQTAR